MPQKEPQLNYVDHADGILMYLVLEPNTLPWVAEDIYDLINQVEDLDETDFLLLAPDAPVFSVEVACTDGDDTDFEVTLINVDGTQGELVERIENIRRYPANVHIQHYNGFDKSAYQEHD
jgi:hypothetical protein